MKFTKLMLLLICCCNDNSHGPFQAGGKSAKAPFCQRVSPLRAAPGAETQALTLRAPTLNWYRRRSWLDKDGRSRDVGKGVLEYSLPYQCNPFRAFREPSGRWLPDEITDKICT